MDDPYRVLGIDKKAKSLDVKQAYFKLIKKYTPEKYPLEFKRIRAAYEQLKSESSRLKTDLFLFNDPSYEFENISPSKRSIPDIQIRIDSRLSFIIESASDLNRTDFGDDFNKCF